jgi:signal transduction histidine kinase
MQIIQDVMDMHRNAAQESPPVPQGVDVGKIVDQLIELYEPDSREKSITIHCTKMEPVPQVNQDEGVIRRILDNLISNAVKYCHLHERIDISIENKNGVACVKVTDGGPGIPPAEAEKLFQKFSRLSTRPTNNEASSGMGLYLTKMLCNRIGASLDAYNVTGRGACFEVTFSGLS